MTNTNAPRSRILSWCLYDWANSSFTTLVVTFVYSTYFTSTFAADPDHGTTLWSRGIVVSALFIAVLAPITGALADRAGRQRYLLACVLICVGATVVLTFVQPNQPNAVILALAIFVVANVSYELSLVFYNSMLSGLVPAQRLGRVSGYGWALGYIGGLVCLGLALPFATGDPPPLGVVTTDGFNVRATNLIVAIWFLLFSVPMFYFFWDDDVRDKKRSDLSTVFKAVAQTFVHIRRYRQLLRFLIARAIYNDGLVTVFAFGGIYAAGTFGFTISEVIVFGIVLNVVAGLGAWLFGFVDDLLGGKTTIGISLIFLVIAVIVAVVAPNRTWLWVAGCLLGLAIGPNQSASRSLMSRFVPAEHASEFFGFYSLSGKVTAFLGPLLLGILAGYYGQRVGVMSLLLFFIVGGILLLQVDEAEGIAVGSK